MMYDAYIVKRTQIYLDEAQDAALTRLAEAAGVTKSTLIRSAVDRYVDAARSEDRRLTRFRAAVQAARGWAPGLPSGADYVDALRRDDVGRQEALERRRRP